LAEAPAPRTDSSCEYIRMSMKQRSGTEVDTNLNEKETSTYTATFHANGETKCVIGTFVIY